MPIRTPQVVEVFGFVLYGLFSNAFPMRLYLEIRSSELRHSTPLLIGNFLKLQVLALGNRNGNAAMR